MLENIFGFGSGILISIITVIHSYYSWSLNEQEYVEWLESQKIGTFKAEDVNSFAKSYSYTRGLMKVIAPLGAIFGLALTVLMLIRILKYFYYPFP